MKPEYGRRGRVGLIVPPANVTVEPELAAMLPSGASLHVTRLPGQVSEDTSIGLKERFEGYNRSLATAAASFGLQLGAQVKTIVLVFLAKEALDKFRNSAGFEVGADGSVALVELGTGVDINTMNIQDPIVGFVLDNKGLMYNLTLEGTKITKLKK